MMIKWNHSNNPYLNYEYLLLDSTDVLDRPYIRFTNLIWGDVDCEDDFNKLCNYIYPKLRRKEDPFDYEPEFGISDCRFSCYARFPIGAYYICPPNNMDGKMQEL